MFDSIDILIFLMLKYADDRDIGQFLLNIDNSLIPETSGSNVDEEVFLEALYPNKVHLLRFFAFWSVEESDIKLKELLAYHLVAFLECINSYVLTPIFSNTNKINQYNFPIEFFNGDKPMEAFYIEQNRIGLKWCNGVKSSKEDFFNTYIPEASYLRELFHIIIDTYKKYHFYYRINGYKVTKVTFEENNNEIERKYEDYNLVKDSKIYAINKYHGLTIEIPNYFSDIGVVNVQCTSFPKFHDRIVKLLGDNHTLQTCAWCNPITKNTNYLCDNCKKLQDKIAGMLNNKEIETITEETINKEILTIGIEDLKNLSELREKRKDYLNNKLEKFFKYDKDAKKEFHKLLNECFSQNIKSQNRNSNKK